MVCGCVVVGGVWLWLVCGCELVCGCGWCVVVVGVWLWVVVGVCMHVHVSMRGVVRCGGVQRGTVCVHVSVCACECVCM